MSHLHPSLAVRPGENSKFLVGKMTIIMPGRKLGRFDEMIGISNLTYYFHSLFILVNNLFILSLAQVKNLDIIKFHWL